LAAIGEPALGKSPYHAPMPSLMLLQYGNGDSPGIALGDSGKWKCGHYLLLAHAFAVKKYRDSYQKKQGGKIGMALWTEWSEPWRQDQAGGEGNS